MTTTEPTADIGELLIQLDDLAAAFADALTANLATARDIEVDRQAVVDIAAALAARPKRFPPPTERERIIFELQNVGELLVRQALARQRIRLAARDHTAEMLRLRAEAAAREAEESQASADAEETELRAKLDRVKRLRQEIAAAAA